MDSGTNSSSEDSIFNEQTDLDALVDLIPPDDMRKLAVFIGEQKVNEDAFCRILKVIVSQSLQGDTIETQIPMFDKIPYVQESLEDEMRAIETNKSYLDDPLTKILKKELEDIRLYESSQEEPIIDNSIIKNQMYRPIQPEPTIPKVASLADELSAIGRNVQPKEEIEEEFTQPDRIFKVVFVGDSAVGKTCFLHRFCHNRFKPLFNATIGVDFTVKTMKIAPNRAIAMQLWDTAGQERFRSITKQYFRKADGVVLMFDVTSEQSFLNVRNWIDSVKAGVDDATVMCLVGNKVDLFGSDIARSGVYRAADKLATEFGIPFYETSAYTGFGIENCMRRMAENLQRREDNHLEEALRLNMNGNYKKRSWCCI
uniref:Ras-related protein Rab-44 n=1 Tax=Caenorhabditis tropicalis TaxID=1561998 RepID=A0A1I7U263_9PELO